MEDQNENSGSNSKSATGGSMKQLVTAESMIQLALAIPGGCVIGWLAGAGLDAHFHTAWMGITGILLGALGGFIQIFRVSSKYLKRSGQ